MPNLYRIYRIQISAIYAVAALLVLSLAGLGMRAVNANQTSGPENLYPQLTCDNMQEVVIPEQKTVYFTFDDGPSHNTEKILDILKEENIKATFFVCAQQCDDSDATALLRRILEEGHEIGLHSYTHDYGKIYKSLDGYLKDLNDINEYVIEATGYHANILRFPGGSGTVNAKSSLKKEIIGEITRRGYRYYDWDVESGDQTTEVNSAEFLANKIVKGTKDRQRVIVLLHDSPSPKTSPEAVKLAIPILREQGYAFDKLTACVDPEKHFS